MKQQSHQEQNISCLNSKQSVSCINVVSPVLSATIPGQPQKKGLRPVQNMKSIKLVKGVSCVVLSHFAPSVQSVPHVVTKTSVGGRLQSFWQVWQKLGSNPRVVSLLRDGYSLPFRERPHLSRFPLIEQIRKPFQKQGPDRSSVVPKTKASSGKGGNQVLAGFLQPPIPSPKTQRTMASDLGPKPTQPVPVNGHFQDGNSGDNPVITSARGMGHFAGLQRCLLPHPHCSEIQKVSEVPHEQGQLPLHLPSLWSSNCPVGIHQGGQGGQTNGSSKGYQDPPVPRRLVATSPFPGNLPTAYPDPLGPMSRTGLAGKHAKVRTGAPTGFQLRRLPVRPVDRSGLAHSGPASQSKREAPVHQGSGLLYCSSVHVPDRSSDCDRKASVCWSAPYEANSVAPEASLACAGTSGEGNSGPQVSPSSFGLVVGRQQCSSGSTFAPSSTRPSSLYRRFKRRLGRSLRRSHCKRSLVSTRRKTPHKFSGAEGGFLGPKELRASVQEPGRSNCDRQHNCSLLHKQGGRYEIRLSLCPPLETSVLVPSQGNSPAGQTYSGSLECDS